MLRCSPVATADCVFPSRTIDSGPSAATEAVDMGVTSWIGFPHIQRLDPLIHPVPAPVSTGIDQSNIGGAAHNEIS
ncbi:hypothetical protein J6590_005774 [Homalodisca vitripennis]|nr:hypothetical protein J6590_005774 [Homalodisca vitripennis]